MFRFYKFLVTKKLRFICMKYCVFSCFIFLIFNLLGCSHTRINTKPNNKMPNDIYDHHLSLPAGYQDAAEGDTPDLVKKFVKDLKRNFPKGIYNSNSGTLILLGSIEELGDHPFFKLKEKVKDLRDHNKLKEFLYQFVPSNAKWLKLKNLQFIDSIDHSIFGGTIEAAFTEIAFLFGWHHKEGSVIKKSGIVALTLYRPSVSDEAMIDILTILN